MIMTNLKVLMNKGVYNLPSSSFSLCQKVSEKLKNHIYVLIKRAIENEIYHIYIYVSWRKNFIENWIARSDHLNQKLTDFGLCWTKIGVQISYFEHFLTHVY